VTLNPRSLINLVLVAVLVLCTLGSYFGWGWAIFAIAAAVALTRPWLPPKVSGPQLASKRVS
jgi:hypothetical protein